MTMSQQRPEKCRDCTARRAVGWKTRQTPKAECPQEPSGLPVHRRLRGSKVKSRRSKPRCDKSQETTSPETKHHGKGTVKKGRHASVPLLRTGALTRQRECDSEGAITSANKTPADRQVAERPVISQGLARRNSKGTPSLLRSNQSDKWQKAMIRKHQSTIRRGRPSFVSPPTRTGSTDEAEPLNETDSPTKRPGYRDIAAVIKTHRKVDSPGTRDRGSAVKVHNVDRRTRSRDKSKSKSCASDVAHGADNRDRVPRRVGRKTRARIAASEPQVPKTQRTKASGGPTRLVRRKSTKKTLSSKEEGNGSGKTRCVKV